MIDPLATRNLTARQIFIMFRHFFQNAYFVTTYSRCSGIDGRCVQKKKEIDDYLHFDTGPSTAI